MPEVAIATIIAKEAGKPKDDAALVPMTCPWAQDGLNKALDGMNSASGGVEGYGVGSRHVRFKTVDEQAAAVAYWSNLVTLLCGTDPLPSSITGAESAMRVVPRDL